MLNKLKTSALLVLLTSLSPALAHLRLWKMPEPFGSNPRRLVENSGMAVSRGFPGWVYSVNDSGSGPYVYVHNFEGQIQMRLRIPHFRAKDVEDLAYGPCYDNRQCLFVADTGNNGFKRQSASIAILLESNDPEEPLLHIRTLRFQYENGQRINSEALALDPVTRSLILASKQRPRRDGKLQEVQLFQIPESVWKTIPDSNSPTEEADVVAVKWKELDIVKMLSGVETNKYAVTGMDISEDGNHLLLLTYQHAVEVSLRDLYKEGPKFDEKTANPGYQVVLLQKLRQQESVAYLPGSTSFVYTTERSRALMKVDLLSDKNP